MRRLLLSAAAGLCLAPLSALARGSEVTSSPAQPAAKAKPVQPAKPAAADKKEDGGCSGHGTNVDFFDTPSEAAAKAKKQQKLVFVLHVSGNFEDPRFT